MNNKIMAVVAVVIIVVAGLGIAYILTRDDGGTDGNTIIDARGREVTVPEEINSILAIKSCSLQLVSFFDAVNKVDHLDINESFTDTNRTHTFVLKDLLQGLPPVDPNDAEQVIMAHPDIVISSTVSISDLNNEQAKYGVPVFAINADVEYGSDEMYKQILALGELFGEQERAAEIVDGIKTFIGDIEGNVSSVSGMNAYACGMNFYGAAQTPFLRASGDYLPFEYSKVSNIYPSVTGGQPYDTDIETLISKNPNIIFIDGIGLASSIDYINANKVSLSMVDAISNDNIYKVLVYKMWGTNWVNLLINVYYVASIVHDGEFSWTFDDKANEIIQLFYPGTSVTYSDLAAAQSGGGCGKVTL